MKGKKIILIRLRSLGDTLLMTPALSIAGQGGANQVAVVVEEPFDQILEGNPDAARIILAGRRGCLRSRWRAFKEIRAFRADMVFDLHGGSTSALMTFFSGAPQRIGFAASRNSRYYNLKVPDSRNIWGKVDVHTVEHQVSPLIQAGFQIDSIPELFVRVDEESREMFKGELAREGIVGRFVLIHPAAAFATKQWPVDGFAYVARELAGRGIPCVTTAGPGQEGLLRELADKQVPRLKVIPPQSLKKFTALASLCTLYLGNDTGPTHIASALGKKVVAVFGSSDSVAWHPWGTECRVVKSDLPCIPCPGYKCLYYDEPACIRSIAGEAVLNSVLDLLSL